MHTLDLKHPRVLLILFALALMVIGCLLLLQALKGSPTGLLETELETRSGHDLDLYQLSDDTDHFHCLQFAADGLVAQIKTLDDGTLLKEIPLPHLVSGLDPINWSRNRIIEYCYAYDLNDDGSLEAIIHYQDTTRFRLIGYSTTGKTWDLFDFRQPESSEDARNYSELVLLGIANFGQGPRLIVQMLPEHRRIPTEIIVVDPVNHQIEARWEIGFPTGCFGFRSSPENHYTGFYLSTYSIENNPLYHDTKKDRAYLLNFEFSDGLWGVQPFYAGKIPHGSLHAHPLHLPDGDRWLITSGIRAHLTDLLGVTSTSAITSQHGPFQIEHVIDRDNDHIPDLIYISNQNEILSLRIDQTGELQIDKTWSTVEKVRGFNGTQLFLADPTDRQNPLLAVVTNRRTLTFLNQDLNPIGAISISVILRPSGQSNAERGESKRIFLHGDATSGGTALLSGLGGETIIRFKPQYRLFGLHNLALVAIFFLLGIGLVWVSFLSLKSGQKAEAKMTTERQLFVQTMKIFRKKPSDVILYMDAYHSNGWTDLQQKITRRTREVLASLEQPVTHDSIREEVGLPMAGTERLINLLILRRVALHFLQQGISGIHLMRKLNFTLEPKYVTLIKEARAILKRALDSIDHGTLTDREFEPVVRQLADEGVIDPDIHLRRVTAEITKQDDDNFNGIMRMTLGGKEIKLTLEQGQVQPAYHGKLSPSFTNFMSVLGLAPDLEPDQQPLFAEETAYLATLN